jgi:hypothetical protein
VEHARSLDLETRLSRLEREVRRWRRLAALAPLTLVVATVAGLALPAVGGRPTDGPVIRPQTVGDVVEARRFVLRDTEGRTRATLAVADDGIPRLSFVDADGETRAALGPRHLYLAGEDGGAAIKLFVNQGGTPALRLEQAGRLRAVLGMTADGTLALGFYGQDGKGRALLDVGSNGAPGLTLFHASGKIAWSAP